MKEKKNDICEEFCFNRSAVNYVKKRMLDEQELEVMTDIFKALGDRTRNKILHALAQKELCVCDLAVALGISISAVSHQLRVLKAARLVKYRRDGKNVYYSMDDEHVTMIFRQALEHVRHN